MLMVTSLMDRENYMEFPMPLCEQWCIEEGQRLYISVNKNEAVLSKTQKRNAFHVNICVGLGIFIPSELAKKLNFRRNSEMVLTLQDDVVTVSRGKVTNLGFTDKEKFENKVRVELDKAKEWTTDAKTMEDICMFLILSTWDKEVIEKLIDKPNLLEKLAAELYEDDEYQEFFDRKLRELILKESL